MMRSNIQMKLGLINAKLYFLSSQNAPMYLLPWEDCQYQKKAHSCWLGKMHYYQNCCTKTYREKLDHHQRSEC